MHGRVRSSRLTHGGIAGRAELPCVRVVRRELIALVDIKQDVVRNRLIPVFHANLCQPAPLVQDHQIGIEGVKLRLLLRRQIQILRFHGVQVLRLHLFTEFVLLLL